MTIYQNLIAGSGFLQGPKGDTGPAANTNIVTYEYIATQGQTTFTGVDANLQTLAYTPTGLIVTLNGSVLNDTTDYVATNGTSIVLNQAANAGDELMAYTFPAFNVANTYTQAQVTSLLATKLNLTGGTIAGELVITGNTSITSNGYLQVPIGTTAQRPSTTTPGFIRYNTDLNSLESANGTAWSNVGSGSASSGGGVSWNSSIQNTSFIAIKNTGYFVNTATGNVIVTLPATPTLGDTVTFVDYGKTFTSNNLILYPNGNKIDANTSNVNLPYNTMSVQLVYTDTNKGWVSYGGLASSLTANYYVDYLVVAGGGGGAGGNGAAGGGAGGYIENFALLLNPGTSYPVVVGAGGSAGTNNGSNSSIFGQTAIGGGGAPAGSGGSGAGAYGAGGSGSYNNTVGSGTAGQGNPGGSGYLNNYGDGGGGGGGAGASGSNAGNNSGGSGGIGKNSVVGNGYYAGGGGGGSYNGPGGPGGNGGGGNGGNSSAGGVNATAGSTNKGGGGGGSGNSGGSAGGSGVVIIRYLGNTPRALGGSTSVLSGYVYHTFTSSGTFVA